MKWIKAIAGLAVLGIVFLTVMSFIGNAREDLARRQAPETETSPTPAANGGDATTDKAAENTEKPPASAEQTAPQKVVIVVIDGLNFRK
jgi:predicted lipid-binding transport protein (Tim44 family)